MPRIITLSSINVGEDVEREREYLAASVDGLLDGLIIVNARNRDETLAFLEKENITTVLIDTLATATTPSVTVDNVQAAYMIVSHLIDLGHQRIAHIAGPATLLVSQLREQGYQKALAERNLPYRKTIHSKSREWVYQVGYEAMQELLRSNPRPTAIFASSDQMAIGAYRAITEAGLAVPEDFSVVGFDDIDIAAFVVPALTTIRQPFSKLASRAVSLLFQFLAGEEPEITQIILPPQLIVRQSTKEL